MPSNFHTLYPSLSSSYQTNTIYSHFFKNIFKLLYESSLRIHSDRWYRNILKSKQIHHDARKNLLAAMSTLLSLCSQCSEQTLTEGKHDFHGHSHVCPWQVAFSFGGTDLLCSSTFHNSGWQVFPLPVPVCTLAWHRHLFISGCGRIIFHGPRLLLSLLRPLHASQTLCRLRKKCSKNTES